MFIKLKLKKFLRSHLSCSGVHCPPLHVRYLLPPAWMYPTTHTYWTRSPDPKDVLRMYLSARLVWELLLATGTPHPPAGSPSLAGNTVLAADTVLAGDWVVSGDRVVSGEGRHRGGSGCHWPRAPHVICCAPSSWKPWLQVKVTLSPTWCTETSPRLLTELVTAGGEQVGRPSEEIKILLNSLWVYRPCLVGSMLAHSRL